MLLRYFLVTPCQNVSLCWHLHTYRRWMEGRAVTSIVPRVGGGNKCKSPFQINIGDICTTEVPPPPNNPLPCPKSRHQQPGNRFTRGPTILNRIYGRAHLLCDRNLFRFYKTVFNNVDDNEFMIGVTPNISCGDIGTGWVSGTPRVDILINRRAVLWDRKRK